MARRMQKCQIALPLIGVQVAAHPKAPPRFHILLVPPPVARRPLRRLAAVVARVRRHYPLHLVLQRRSRIALNVPRIELQQMPVDMMRPNFGVRLLRQPARRAVVILMPVRNHHALYVPRTIARRLYPVRQQPI